MRTALRAGCQLLLGSLFVFCLFAPVAAAGELPSVVELSDEVPSVFVPVELESDGVLHVQFGSGVSCEEFQAGWPFVLDALLRVRNATGAVVAEDDDGDHSELNCLGAKVHVELLAGSYVVELTRYGSTVGEGVVVWGESVAVPTTTTTSTTTTSTTTTSSTTTSTTSTSTTTTTTTLVPSTSTSTTTTTTTSVAPTTTVPPTTTTSTLLPTTTSSSTTTVPPTTTTTSTTTSTTVVPVTSTLLATTSSSTSSTTTTTLPATTTSLSTTTSSTTTAAPILTTTLPAVATVTNPPAPPGDATEAEKELFEQQVDIYSSDDYVDYVPAGSTISVGQRRTVIAATVVISASPVMPTRRRNR